MSNPLKNHGDLAEMLDQPADGADRFHPHAQVRASTDVVADLDRLATIIRRFTEFARSGEEIPQATADALSGEASRLLLRSKNRLSAECEPERSKPNGRGGRWSMR